MTDIQLFRLSNGVATELSSQTAKLERDLQILIEANMATCLGVRFLAREHPTGKTHRGRIDSLGLDENGCPVIIEYKRHSTENVINQGLFYLDWLMDHQAEFRWLVMEKLGKEAAGRSNGQGRACSALQPISHATTSTPCSRSHAISNCCATSFSAMICYCWNW